jgi:hypothetical protein
LPLKTSCQVVCAVVPNKHRKFISPVNKLM